jgi:hypothetical protein
MPYLDEHGLPLRVIPLTQAPQDGHYFQLARPIGFREYEGAEAASNPTYWAPAHVPSDDPEEGNRTDLASVPWPFWSFIASYGRQTAPAIIHDHRGEVANTLDHADALRQREEDDRIFRVGLRQQHAPLLRAWLMWAFVSVGRYWDHARIRCVLLALQSLLGIAAIILSVILAFSSPLWLLLALVPAAASVAWGRQTVLLLWLSYASALIAPLVVLQLCALAPFWVAEVLVRELIDRPFIDSGAETRVGPFFR